MAGEYNKSAATPAPISGKILFLRVARLMRGQLRHEIEFIFTVIVIKDVFLCKFSANIEKYIAMHYKHIKKHDILLIMNALTSVSFENALKTKVFIKNTQNSKKYKGFFIKIIDLLCEQPYNYMYKFRL